MSIDAVSVLSKGLGGLFVYLGSRKVINFSDAIQQDYNEKFIEFARVFPLSPLGIVPNNVTYKYLFGGAEIVLGGMVIFGNRRMQRTGCLGLAGMMGLAAQTAACLGDFGSGFFLPIVVGGALGWVYVQLGKDDQKITDKPTPATKKS